MSIVDIQAKLQMSFHQCEASSSLRKNLDSLGHLVCIMNETAKPSLHWNKLKALLDILKINLLFLLSGNLSQCGRKKFFSTVPEATRDQLPPSVSMNKVNNANNSFLADKFLTPPHTYCSNLQSIHPTGNYFNVHLLYGSTSGGKREKKSLLGPITHHIIIYML